MKALRNQESRELALSLAAIIALIAVGTLGYYEIEGWSVLDSLYMTITTVATVGFGEVHPLSGIGRIFTIILIVFGVGVAAVVFSSVTRYVMQRQISFFFEGKRMKQAVKELKGHTIICGYGRLSRIAAQQLKDAGIPLVIVERSRERAADAEDAGFLVVVGDAAVDQTLSQAGILNAKRLVSLLPNDADNLYVILASRELNRDLYIISRAEDEVGERRLVRAGANRVTSPYTVGARKIADGILRPYVTDFIDLAVSDPNVEMQIEELKIPERSPMVGQNLEESGIRQKTNVIVAAIIGPNGEMTFNPSGKTVIESKATLIALGLRPDLSKLEQMLIAPANS